MSIPVLNNLANQYYNFIDRNASVSLYLTRNDDRVVHPFISGLGCAYIQIDQTVIVLSNKPEFLVKLISLGFIATIDTDLTIYNTVKKEYLATNLKGGDRLYSKDFNIEVQVVKDEDWYNVTLANLLTNNLKVSKFTRLQTFLNLYNTLSNN